MSHAAFRTHARPALTAIACVTTALLVAGSCAQASEHERVVSDRVGSEYHTVRIVEVAGDLENPWGLAFLPDGAMLVTERPGRINLVRDGEVTSLGGVPDDLVARNQGGMLDIAVHPEYEDNGWIYFAYSKGTRQETATTLVRARIDGDQLTDVEQIFTQDRKSGPGRHYGSRLAFLPDGTLLMSIGDRGQDPPRAQDLEDHAGTLLRLNDDGSVPEDNPFVDDDDVLPEIYSYGHRNIQGLIVHPETEEIWVNDHGPRGGDRLDLVKPGANYGWPVVSPGRDYGTQEQWGEGREKEGMEPPIREFLPTVAPSGFAIVTGDRYPRWEGNFLIGGLRSEQIRRVVIENETVVHEEELIREELGRIRDVRMGPDDYIYVLNDRSDGGVYRLEPR